MRRVRISPNCNKPIDVSTKATYAVCRNLYASTVAGDLAVGLHTCVCENQGRGQTCDQMNRAALAVIKVIVKEYK